MKTGRPRNIPIKDIRRDRTLHARCIVDDEVVGYYATFILKGAVFPPVTVFEDKAGIFWLADGFLRVAAFERAGKTEVPAVVFEGERSDAAWAALGANKFNQGSTVDLKRTLRNYGNRQTAQN